MASLKSRIWSSYRAARRNLWRVARRSREATEFTGMSWQDFNLPMPGGAYAVGWLPAIYAPAITSRSKYRPHQGKREMARRVK